MRINKKFNKEEEELETVYLFLANFKVNSTLVKKELNPQFIIECKKDRKIFSKQSDYS